MSSPARRHQLRVLAELAALAGQLHAAAADNKQDSIRSIAAQIESEMQALLAFIAAYGKD